MFENVKIDLEVAVSKKSGKEYTRAVITFDNGEKIYLLDRDFIDKLYGIAYRNMIK